MVQKPMLMPLPYMGSKDLFFLVQVVGKVFLAPGFQPMDEYPADVGVSKNSGTPKRMVYSGNPN